MSRNPSVLEGLSLQYCHTIDLALEDKLNSLRALKDAKARNTKGNYILCCALPMLPFGNPRLWTSHYQ